MGEARRTSAQSLHVASWMGALCASDAVSFLSPSVPSTQRIPSVFLLERVARVPRAAAVLCVRRCRNACHADVARPMGCIELHPHVCACVIVARPEPVLRLHVCRSPSTSPGPSTTPSPSSSSRCPPSLPPSRSVYLLRQTAGRARTKAATKGQRRSPDGAVRTSFCFSVS